MPRSSSSSRSSGSRSFSTFRPTKPSLPPPAPVIHRPSPPPAIYTPTPVPTLGQAIKEGFGLGIGMSVARNVVDRAFGALGTAFQQAPGAPRPFTGETLPPPATQKTSEEMIYTQCLAVSDAKRCSALSDLERNEWLRCMKESKQDASACSHMFITHP